LDQSGEYDDIKEEYFTEGGYSVEDLEKSYRANKIEFEEDKV